MPAHPTASPRAPCSAPAMSVATPTPRIPRISSVAFPRHLEMKRRVRREPVVHAGAVDERCKRMQLVQMGTLAVVSRKGGSGKSTLATHLAAYLARRTDSVTLGDLDHKQSMRLWLSRRPSAAPRVIGWVGDSGVLARPAFGTQHLVLDTPGGLHGLGLARVVMAADAILLPVGARCLTGNRPRTAGTSCAATPGACGRKRHHHV